MSAPAVSPTFPKPVILGAGILLALTIALAAAGRHGGIASDPPAQVETLMARELVFEDRGAGLVIVRDAATAAVIAELQPGTENFVRGVMRGFARERRQKDIGPEPPVVLTLDAEGGLALGDPSTGRSVDLNAFGPTNRDSFIRLLTAGRSAS